MVLERVGRVRQLAHVSDPGTLGRGEQEPVVGADEDATLPIRDHDGPPDTADPRIDDREVDPRGMYGSVLERTSAPWSTCVAGIPCVRSMTRASGAIRAMTPWHVPTKSSCSPKSVRKEADHHGVEVYGAASADPNGVDQP